MALRAIEDLLHREIGLHSATVGSDTVRHAVEVRMRACGISGPADYLNVVQHSRTELEQLIDTVVIPETWFFRDHNPFSAFSAWLREEWSTVGSPPPLRILSVPCSTGEEPFTLAMCLADAGFAVNDAVVDAIDISSRNLTAAQQAEYGPNSFRSSDLSFRDRHFDKLDQRFRLKDTIRARVRFSRANLLDHDFTGQRQPYHVIFCRNLLIYFDRATQHRAIDTLAGLLTENGLLFLGHSETSLLKGRPFVALEHARSFGFVHTNTAILAAATEPARPQRGRREVVPQRGAKRARPFAGVATEAQPSNASAAQNGVSLLEQALLLADEGHLDEAALRCETLLQEDSCQAGPWYLLGLIREASGNIADAEQLFRKALYLDPDHYEALTHLSTICDRKGDAQGARRFRDRAARTQAAAAHKAGRLDT